MVAGVEAKALYNLWHTMKPPRKIHLKLFGRLLLSVGLSSLLPLAAVVLIATGNAYRSLEEESFRYTEEQGRRYAALIAGELNSRIDSLQTMASMMGGYSLIPAANRRSVISGELRSILEMNAQDLAAWTLWEPGAIGDDPARADSGLKSPSGAFYSTWHRSDGRIVRGFVDDHIWQGEYYQRPKLRMEPTLIDPYWYSYTSGTDDRVFETTISVPIVVDGAFKGVVGFDFSSDFYGRILSEFRINRTGYAALVASNGKRIWHPIASLIGTYTGEDLPPEKQRWILGRIAEGKPFFVDKKALSSGAWSRQFFIPVPTKTAGIPWFIAAVVPFSEIRHDADRLASILCVIGLVSILVVGLAIYAVARRLSAPIALLSAGARRISSGDLSGRVEIKGEDEIAELAASFNAMTDELQKMLGKYEESNRELAARNAELSAARSSLEALNSGLEAKVALRTELLSQANKSLEERNGELMEAVEQLRNAQEKVVASEKMAVLGKLAASVGHELNTPLGAIRSSIEFIIGSTPTLYDGLPGFFSSLGPGERALFGSLLARARASAADLSRVGDRTARRALAARFASEGFPDPELLADEVETIGAFDLEGEIAAAVRSGRRDIVALASEIARLLRADEIIRAATDKAGFTVAALSDYSRQEGIEASGPFDPVKEIETILVLYHNSMKYGVVVERKFECRDLVLGYRDRLNHVWANIIQNALQAMEYQGRLEIATARSGDWIDISFTDSGPGIAKEVEPLIFKPFFSTKKSGEGTGLGLDICRKIVERCEGKISFESRPGRTTFTVSLKAASPI